MRRIWQISLIAALLIATIGGVGFGIGCSPLPTGETPIPLAAVSGRVSHILTNAVVTNGTVTVTPNGLLPVQFVLGAAGTYSLNGLTAGPARIQVVAPGYENYSANVTLNEGNNTHDIKMVPIP